MYKSVASLYEVFSDGISVIMLSEFLMRLLLSSAPGSYWELMQRGLLPFTCIIEVFCVCVCVCLQHALRMIAFGDIHKVLGMEPLPSAAEAPGQRKRPRANGASAGGLQPN